MTPVIIVNPTAGQRRPLEIAEQARRQLEDTGRPARLIVTERAGHAAEIAATCEASRFIVVGGDGTLRETVEGLGERAARVPVGMVPVGHANVVAREVGIPLDPRRAIETLGNLEPREIDAGSVNGRMFLAMVGVGFDGIVSAFVGRVRDNPVGRFVYNHHGGTLVWFLAGLPVLLRLTPNRVRVIVDGREQSRRAASLIVCNTETYALGWAVTPGASPADGTLDHFATPRSLPPFVLWSLIAAMRHARLPSVIAEYGSGRRYEISSDRPFRWQADGDPMEATKRLEIETLPGRVRLLVPGSSP